MTSPDMIKENERSITFNVDYDSDAQVELDLSCFAGSGSFFAPQTVVENQPLSYVMKDANEVGFGGFQSVWSAKYKCKIKAGAQKTFTQVLTVQESRDYSEQENIEERAYFNQKEYEEKVVKTKDFYEKLFTARTIKTNNQLYDNFINNFTPLQMYWVCSLDRGWPSSMRGTRDASQDFIGILPIFPEWVKETIKELFEHQRTDGWFPRQISTVSRQAGLLIFGQVLGQDIIVGNGLGVKDILKLTIFNLIGPLQLQIDPHFFTLRRMVTGSAKSVFIINICHRRPPVNDNGMDDILKNAAPANVISLLCIRRLIMEIDTPEIGLFQRPLIARQRAAEKIVHSIGVFQFIDQLRVIIVKVSLHIVDARPQSCHISFISDQIITDDI